MSEGKKQVWPELGLITKNVVKDKDKNIVKDENGNPVYRLSFKVSDDITILHKGEPVALNQYRSGILVSPIQETENLYKHGVIGEDKIEASRDKSKEIHKWLRYKVQLPPPRD